MPYINIRTRKVNHQVDMKGFAYELSQQMGINVERINIIVDFNEESEVFVGSNTDYLIATLWISETNERQFIHDLAKTTARLAEKYFHKEDKRAAVICNLIGEGYLFINNQFI